MKCAIALLLCSAAPAVAQLGELQAGVVGSYGVGAAFRAGGGLILGVAAGRLAYVGLRWTYHRGGTRLLGSAVSPTAVKDRVQAFAVDLAAQIPVAAVEVMPGFAMGMLQFAQYDPSGGRYSREFFVAPALAIETRVGRIAIVSDVQYYIGGRPELTWPVPHHGAVASLRFVLLAELRRIRR